MMNQIKDGKLVVWAEYKNADISDKCTPREAYKNLTGEEFDKNHALAYYDHGDHFGYLMQNGWEVWWACDGGFILQPIPS